MMLYAFENLANTLTKLGFPEIGNRGFQIIKRNLTDEENAGNIEFKEDGIYLTIDGTAYKGYMYIKYADIAQYGFPRFHITNCKTIIEQRQKGVFDHRYFWHNSNTVSIEDRKTHELHQNINLQLCNNCRIQSGISDYRDTEGFYSLLDELDAEEFNKDYEVDLFGYTFDWEKISREYRKEKVYTCECCKLKIEVQGDRRFLHTHHRNGVKINNKRSNLECLCILCHSFKDQTHQHNFEKRKMSVELKAFVSKYSSLLKKIGNPYIDKVK